MSDPKKAKPSQPVYLPRTWKASPEPEVEPKPKDKAAKGKDPTQKPTKKSKKRPEAEAADETGGSKLEETPMLDTVEGRQRVRILIGSVVALVALILIVGVVRKFQPSSPQPDSDTERNQARVAVDPKESLEREAAALVENARQSDKLGRFDVAIKLLTKVTRNYDGTTAAKEAAAALDRERRNRPLFGSDDGKGIAGPVAPKVAPSTTADGKAGTPVAVAPTPAPVAPTPPVQPVKVPEIVARSLPNGFKAESSAPLHPSGWPTRITCDRDGAVMILIPAGEFLMGREDGEPAERPSHRVRLSTYYIDEHEVTNRQYQVYLKETGRATGESPRTVPPERLELPVTSLSAREARSYCYWANRRLPTEAQWELAARSEDGRISSGVDREPVKGDVTGKPLDPVMAFPADRSPAGGFDFGGNAWEWTSDYYDSQYYGQLRGVPIDPMGPTESRIKPAQVAVKGGSRHGILTWREGTRIEARLPHIGFRGALPVEAVAVSAPEVRQPTAPGTNPPGGVIPF